MSYTPAAMTDIDYQAFYDQLSVKVSELCQQQIELEVQLGDVTKQLESLRATMSDLAPLAGYPPSESDTIVNLGITDAVRSALHPSTRRSPAEVKADMEQRGFDFSDYTAPDASIRTILKRLVEAGKAEQEKEGHKIFYRYVPTDEELPF
jgi:hypothetical protein